jgi:hypothetical protein
VRCEIFDVGRLVEEKTGFILLGNWCSIDNGKFTGTKKAAILRLLLWLLIDF